MRNSGSVGRLQVAARAVVGRTAVVVAVSATAIGAAGTAASATEGSFPGCPLLLESNSSGTCVEKLQNELNGVNPSYNLAVTSIFDAPTRVAVLDFQGRNHLGADGNVGSATAAELQRQYDAAQATKNSEAGKSSASGGSARYRVELKAWIPHDKLEEAPPGAKICQPWVPGTKMWYDGDNHVGYEGSYRVLVAYEFLWDGSKISDLSVDGQYGASHLHMAGPLPNFSCENTDRATRATDVTADGNTFTLSIDSANPLQMKAPSINSKLIATMVSGDEMRVQLQTDKFPSHGFAVFKNGVPVATVVDFDASCVPDSGLRAGGLIGNRLSSFEHKSSHDIDLRVPKQKFLGPCEKPRPPALSFPAA